MQTAEMSSVENTQIPHDECEFPLVFTEKGKYKWQGDFAALQKFTEEVLKMKVKWSWWKCEASKNRRACTTLVPLEQ
jgi:hypothetical protein